MISLYTKILIALGLIALAGCSSPRAKAPSAGFYAPKGWQSPMTITESVAGKNKSIVASQVTKPRVYATSKGKKFAQPTEQMEGFASWYGPGFHGKKTANGESYNQMGMTAAHRYLPMNTWLRVRNLENGKSIVIRVNDRGPYKKNRILDLTKRASKKLGFFDQGTARVHLEVLKYPKDFDHEKGLKAYQQAVVQLAVFRSEDRAANFAGELHRRFTRLDFSVDQPREGVYHVILGPYQERDEAKKVGKSLTDEGLEAFVRSYRK